MYSTFKLYAFITSLHLYTENMEIQLMTKLTEICCTTLAKMTDKETHVAADINEEMPPLEIDMKSKFQRSNLFS